MENFTNSAKNALKKALELSGELGSPYVGSEHLLLGILTEKEGSAESVLTEEGISYELILEKVREFETPDVCFSPDARDMTPVLQNIIKDSALRSAELGHRYIGTEHLLLSMMDITECVGTKLIILSGGVPSIIKTKLIRGDEVLPISEKSEKLSENMKKYTTDLTAKARRGELDPVIGRDLEIARVVGILCRRRKNNPCLIGEAGVGKTAVAEGLARLIDEGNVPSELKGKIILNLDLTLMISGAKYRGEFEERLKKVMDEARANKNIILFIDEIHTIIGAGSAEGALDAANIIKPALARGEIQLIGATTRGEYRKHIEKDPALERRFITVDINEPSAEKSIEILKGIRGNYEIFHGIAISDEAISAAVELSERYITGKYLPDKAIDILDEAAARCRLERKEKNDAVLGYDEIADAVFSMTGIPVTRGQSSTDINMLENALKREIVGQDECIDIFCRGVKRALAGMNDGGKPLCSFLFAGSTGVGKTEFAKVCAEVIFGKGALVRFDMSEYTEKESVSRLIGASPGYVGYSEGGLLCKKVRARPYSLVLFDEIEKAHHEIYDLLLQVLDEGRLTSADGTEVNFKNTIIVMTSNLGMGSNGEKSSIGFTKNSGDERKKRENIIKGYFREEFINRLDGILFFKELTMEDCIAIGKKFLKSLKNKLDEKGIDCEFSEDAVKELVKKGYIKSMGARNIKRTVQNIAEDGISELLLEGKIKKGDGVILKWQNGEFLWDVREGKNTNLNDGENEKMKDLESEKKKKAQKKIKGEIYKIKSKKTKKAKV